MNTELGITQIGLCPDSAMNFQKQVTLYFAPQFETWKMVLAVPAL